jgi:plasmid maintenance system antidote protein VapI
MAKKDWEKDIAIMKMLMILLANKMGVKQNAIAKTLGITEGRLSQLLNPKKYNKKK